MNKIILTSNVSNTLYIAKLNEAIALLGIIESDYDVGISVRVLNNILTSTTNVRVKDTNEVVNISG